MSIYLPKKLTHAELVLLYLAAGHSLNRLEAEQVTGDARLRDAIKWARDYLAIPVKARVETIDPPGGSKTRVVRYWLSPIGRKLAREQLLNRRYLRRLDHAA